MVSNINSFKLNIIDVAVYLIVSASRSLNYSSKITIFRMANCSLTLMEK